MRMAHPDFPGQSTPVVPSAFESVWRHRGWVEAPDLPDLDGITVDEVLELVGEDPVAAGLALQSEREGRNRVTLIDRLERLAGSASQDAGDGAASEE